MYRSSVRRTVVLSIATLIVVSALAISGYFLYTQYVSGWWQHFQIQQQSKAVLTEIGRVVRLPSNETPQIATILNASQLKQGDQFFVRAENGDALLIYKESGLIVLFSLASHKVLNMGLMATSSAGAVVPVGSVNITQ